MRRLVLALALALSCDPRTLPPYGEVLLVVDTDTLVPTLASHFRLDVYSADGKTWIDSRDVARVDEHDWPVSLSVWSPDLGSTHTALVRVRVHPEGKVRDYRGERLSKDPPPEAKSSDSWPDPMPSKDERPRLFDASGHDITPFSEPEPVVTMDRLLLVRLDPGVRGSVRIVMHAACIGSMADIATLQSCLDTSHVRVPATLATLDPDLSPPKSSTRNEVGKPRPCAVVPRPVHADLFDEDVCIDGGGFILGNRDVSEFDDPSSRFSAGWPERAAIVRPFRIDRWEVTVARWREATGRGFNSPDLSPEPNDEPLDRATGVTSTKLCTWSTIPIAAMDRESYPLNCVSWDAARAFCRWAGGDLPTEAQWEYVAEVFGRPAKTLFPWGDAEPDCNRAVFGRLGITALMTGNSRCRKDFPQGPQPVTTDSTTDVSLGAGVIGLGGSLSEFTRDGFASMGSVCWARATLDDPQCDDPALDAHANRGGDWAQNTLGVYSGVRLGQKVDALSTVVGFRCVTELP